MKLDNYRLVRANIMPCYLYIEGDEKEKYYVDSQTCESYLFKDDDIQKYWIIMLYKPNNIFNIDKDNIHLCKWLVSESYHDSIDDEEYNNVNYEYYEWDFKNHCIKKD